MSMLPYFALWILLLAAAALAWFVGRRGRLAGLIGPLATVAAAALWWLIRPDEPVVAGWAGWQWLIDSAAWQLTGLAILLAFGASLAAFLTDWSQPDSERAIIRSPGAAILVLAATLLPLLWAGDGRTLVTGYALMLVSWLAVARQSSSGQGPNRVGRWPGGSVLVVGLLSLWLAVGLAGNLGGGAWAPVALLVAGLVGCGVFPVGSWRAAAVAGEPATGVMLLSIPVLAGARLLWPLAQPGSLNGPLQAAGTALGLVAVLWAIWSLFSNGTSARMLAVPTGGALGGLLLLAALWGGPEALLAQTRVAVLAPAVLLLLARSEVGGTVPTVDGDNNRLRQWARVPGLGLAALAVAAVPLTAGFRGLGGVYEAWLAVSGWPLVAVAALLIMLLIAGLVSRGWRALHGQPLPSSRGVWLGAVPSWILALGMVALPPVWLGAASPLTWAAVLLALVMGLALAYLFSTRLEVTDAASAIVPSLPAGWRDGHPTRLGRQVVELAGEATADALAILEGPYGLLWILGLLVLFMALA